MDAARIRPNLWRWTAPHPDWTPDEGGPEGWEREVASYLYDGGDALVLFDPLAPPDGTRDAARFWDELDRDIERAGSPHILLTVYWHVRSSPAILERYDGARLWAHTRAAQPIRKRVRVTDTFRPGEPLPGGVEARESGRGGEILFWIPEHGALVAGDVLLGAAGGGLRVCPDSWLGERITPQELRERLRRLLELPIELILLTHGEPVLERGRDALERALR